MAMYNKRNNVMKDGGRRRSAARLVGGVEGRETDSEGRKGVELHAYACSSRGFMTHVRLAGASSARRQVILCCRGNL